MSPIDRVSTQNKLARLNEIIRLLQELGAHPKENFMIDKTLQSATMYDLVIGIEIISDVGNHFLAELGDANSKSYREIILRLGARKIIPETFANANQEMAGFRNKLIHDYDRVSEEKVYGYLQEAPKIFAQFFDYYNTFLEKQRPE